MESTVERQLTICSEYYKIIAICQQHESYTRTLRWFVAYFFRFNSAISTDFLAQMAPKMARRSKKCQEWETNKRIIIDDCSRLKYQYLYMAWSDHAHIQGLALKHWARGPAPLRCLCPCGVCTSGGPHTLAADWRSGWKRTTLMRSCRFRKCLTDKNCLFAIPQTVE